MKKVVVALGTATIVIVLLVIFLIIQSFKLKPVFKSVDQKLKNNVQKVVIIPDGINPPNKTFETSTYEWEMETPAGEVSRVRLTYPNAYSKNEREVKVTLELPEGGDASIFDKILPAVVSDGPTLAAALDPQKIPLPKSGPNYNSVSFGILPSTGQTTKISWIIAKDNLDKDLASDYGKLTKYPISLLKFLYGVPSLLIKLAAG